MIRRTTRLLLLVLLLPLLALATLAAALNTAPGQDLAITLLDRLTAGTVRATGLSGRFPDRLHLARLELHDGHGAWLTADSIALDWSPTALLHRTARIHRLAAASLHLDRLPHSDPSPAPADSPPFHLPLAVTLEQLDLPRIALGAPLLGTPINLAATGAADLAPGPILTDPTGTATLRLSAPDNANNTRYTLDTTITPTTIDLALDAQEPANGPLARLAALPDLGPIRLAATAQGPRAALATTLTLSAGPLQADATATIDLPAQSGTLDLTASAPAMRFAPGIAWQSIDLTAHLGGPLTAPDATARLRLVAAEAAGAAIRSLQADLTGNTGQITLDAVINGLRLPTPSATLPPGAPPQPTPATQPFAADPTRLTASLRLDDPAQPLRFTLAHPLLQATGQARLAAPGRVEAHLTLPDLAPIAALAGPAVASQGLAGRTAIDLRATRTGDQLTLDSTGTLTLTAGPGPTAALIGQDAPFALAATLHGTTLAITRLTLDAAALALTANGTGTPNALAFNASLTAPDLARLAPTLRGATTLTAQLRGPPDAIALDAALEGTIGTPDIAPTPLHMAATLTGLPTRPAGRITGTGTLAGSPLALDIDANQAPDGTGQLRIAALDWTSLHATGALTLAPGQSVPSGTLAARIRLDDLRPLTGLALQGTLAADATFDPAAITLALNATDTALPGLRLARARLDARIADPLGLPVIAATLDTQGLATGPVAGTIRIEAKGPADAIDLRTTAALTLAGTPARLAATTRLDTTARRLRLDTLQLTARNETLRLQSPATIRFDDQVAIDRLRLALRTATLDISGRLSPTLDTQLALRLPAGLLSELATIIDPTLPALDGALTLDARLAGTPARPAGTLRLAATALRPRAGPARALPPANLTATAQLDGATARLNARLAAGSTTLSLDGTAPLGDGALALRTDGSLDLAILDPILAAEGRRLRGRVTLAGTATGPLAAPRLGGQLRLANGEIQDIANGLRLTALSGTIDAQGDTLRLATLTGRAGPGTIAATGTLAVLAPTRPLDLTLTLRNARPLASDLVTADLDADLTLCGPLAPPAGAPGLAAAGRILIRRADLQVPTTFPPTIAVLDVRRPGQAPPPPAPPPTPIRLDLTIEAPQSIYLRGRGIDAELAGRLTLAGTTTAPEPGGALTLRRGSVALAGTALAFTRGRIGFDGNSLAGRIDPTLDFAADSTAGGVTATLNITGYVSRPVIKLSSVPELPQDEILARLIFGRSAKALGPFQIAQIATGLAELSGAVSAGLNPLEAVRKGLGLDRLSIGTATNAAKLGEAAPTLEGGRYVAEGVYVGARQGTTGANTQATVQIDLTRGLKLEADVGTGLGANQIGITWQHEY